MRTRMGLLGTAAWAALAFAVSSVPATSPAVAQDRLVKIDGSSTVFPVTEAVAEEFQNSTRGRVKVTVGISGTGGGFKKFCRGETDISNASRPIMGGEMALARENGVEYFELPICFDAITVAVHKDNTWATSMTVEELKRLWEPEAQGKITMWSQVRAGWPEHRIDLFGPGTDSGTFDYFTEAVVGKAKSSRGDFTGSEDDNVLVRGIEGNRHALGYLPFAYYAENTNRLRAVAIDWEQDEHGPMLPDMDNVVKGLYNPLSRPLFLYVNRNSYETKPWVKQFVDFYLEHAAELAEEVKYLPLPARAYEMARDRLRSGQTGTAFGGEPEVGVSVEEILSRQPTR
ncbi:MAG: PstS family phosphate ABC transporter substrate-binding protein [Phycisphaerales bacterium]|nr:PstS family phosphate ABC transporter substrate-binding protein [Phycisphaerales bacterium]